MASLDSLPADQKAVLSLVLQRRQSFDQIAALLLIDRASVRQRALEGLDALGPDTSVDPLTRGLITDYLLGQLPPAVAERVFTSLATNPPERAWARVVAAEIAPLAVNPLPEIPAAGASAPPRAVPATPGSPEPPAATPDPPALSADADEADRYADDAEAGPPPGVFAPPAAAMTASPAAATPLDEPSAAAPAAAASMPPSSRRGGALLLGLIAVVVIVVVVVILVSGGSGKTKTTQTNAQAPTTSAITTAASTSTTVTPLHQINLISPSSTKGREGAADVVRANGKLGIVLVAEGLAANTKNAYGVWLYNSKTQASKFLGFYDQQVTATGSTKGELEAEDQLPTNATSYNQLLLTLETAEKPTTPGTIVLQGSFAE